MFNNHYGLFLVRFDEMNPLNYKFILCINDKVEIDDGDIVIIRDVSRAHVHHKDLLISYKTIFMNSYHLQIIDLCSDQQYTIYWHESFQLWECRIAGFFVQKSFDYITINNKGISITNIGVNDVSEVITESDNIIRLHSLESNNYLKIETSNMIHF